MVLETLFSEFKVQQLQDCGEQPGKRWGHTFTALPAAGEALLIGGIKDATDLSQLAEEVWILDLRTLRWTCVPLQCDRSCVCRAFHSATKVSEYEVLIFGGWQAEQFQSDSQDVFIYNSSDKKWTIPDVSGRKPGPRQGHSATFVNACDVIVYGGWNGSIFCDELILLDTCSWCWNTIETTGLCPTLAEHSCFMQEWKLYFHGGFGIEGVNKNSYVLDLVTKEWSKVQDNNDVCVGSSNVAQCEVIAGSFAIRFGGCESESGSYEERTYSNWMKAISLESLNYSHDPVEVDLLQPRAYHSMIQCSKQCLLLYGGRNSKEVFCDLWTVMLPDNIVVDLCKHLEKESFYKPKLHPALLEGPDREERIIEKEIDRRHVLDHVSSLKSAIENKDRSLSFDRKKNRSKIEWLQQQIEVVKSELLQLQRYKESLK